MSCNNNNEQIQELENPAPSWLSARSWKEILSLKVLPSFEKFVDTFPKELERYKLIFDSKMPHR